MGQCVTVNVGNDGAVLPQENASGNGGTSVNVGGNEEEEEEEEGMCGCVEDANCLPCL